MKTPTKLKKAKQEIIKAARIYNTEFDAFTDCDANNNQYYYFNRSSI